MAQQHDRTDTATTHAPASDDGMQGDLKGREKEADDTTSTAATRVPADKRGGFDWLALSIVVLTAAIFAVAGRLYAQPPTSLVPVAVLSASGCGLLITALRKMRTSKGAGLPEAALAGFCIAALQFLAALSYPGVVASLGDEQIAGPGFFSTWALIAFFSILFSVIGATLGHLAFAPLRPLSAHKRQARPARRAYPAEDELPESSEEADADQLAESAHEEAEAPSSAEDEMHAEQERLDGDAQYLEAMEPGEGDEQAEQTVQVERAITPQRTTISYAITILMLGFVPMLAGYVFAAAFDYVLNRNGYAPGFFPTLRLLSSLLPWQIPVPIGLQGANAVSFTVSLLWRIPIFFGNSAPFDAQALEPYIFNAAALGLLLVTGFKQENRQLPWSKFVLLEALFGLALVLPADVWMLQGLQGVLQIQSIVAPLGTLHLLDPLTFVLDLVTGVLICIAIGTMAITRTRRDR